MERVHYVDIAKGLLIMLVVLHHIPQLETSKSAAMLGIDYLNVLYISFFMPAFFVLTGMCSNFSKPLKLFVKNKFCSIMIPAFCLGFISMWINLFFSGVTDVREYCKLGFRTFILYGGAYWFLSALFVANVVYWFIKNKIKSTICKYLLLLFCLILGIAIRNYDFQNYWHVSHALILIIFLSVGESIKKYGLDIKIGVAAAFIYIISLILLLFFNVDIPYVTAHVNLNLFETPIFLVLSIGGSISIIVFSKIIGKSSIIESLGKQSLVIYGLHIAILSAIIKSVGRYYCNMSIIQEYVVIVFIFIFALLICYGIALSINNSPLKVLLGKF